MNPVRMDKWLWAARFFKTRAFAVKACDLGRIECNGQPSKPSRDVRVGDLLRIRNEAGEFQVEVLVVSDMRGPASVAQTLYRETEVSVAARAKAVAERKEMLEMGAMTESRPSKRERQQLGRLRGHP